MKKDRYFMDQARKYGPMTLEKCFENMTIDPILMKDIERQGVFSKNQKHYLHEMINRIISYAKKGFVNGTQKISCLDISCTYTWGDDLICHIGMYKDIIYSEFLKDYKEEGLILPKGIVIGSIDDDPFPAVQESDDYTETPYLYGGLLDPDKYGAPHYALDFVNKKLNEALPGHNLWVRAEGLLILNIYNLNDLPHMRNY